MVVADIGVAAVKVVDDGLVVVALLRFDLLMRVWLSLALLLLVR